MDRSHTTPFVPPVPPTFGNIFAISHQLYAARWGLTVGVCVVAIILNMLLSLFAGVLDALIVGSDASFNPVSTLSQILLGAPLLVGPLYVAARLFRGEPAEFSDLFIGFRRWGAVVVVALLVQIIVYAVVIPFGIAIAAVGLTSGGNPVALVGIGAAGLVMLGVVVWITIRLYFATLLCADPAGPNLGIIDSVKTSWRITHGHAWSLFLVAVVLGILAVISLLLLVVPFLIYGAPVLMCAGGVAYALICHKAGLIPLSPYDHCPSCQYDLRGTDSGICPECGAAVIRDNAAS